MCDIFLLFCQTQSASRCSTATEEDDESTIDVSRDVAVFPVCAKSQKFRASKRKAKNVGELSSISQHRLGELRKMRREEETRRNHDADDVYGEYIATEMRKLDNELVKQLVKRDFQDILLKAHLGYYSSLSSATIGTPLDGQVGSSSTSTQHKAENTP